MDSAFKTAPYSGYTTDQLRQMVRGARYAGGDRSARNMRAEIDRREAVEGGDMTRATAGERLRYAQTGKAR
jgi:hypothetical protein